MAITINGGPCEPMASMKNIVPAMPAILKKFEQWAATVPYTLRNPLYHWTHLELQRYFGIHKVLNAGTAKEIYEEATAKLQTKEYSVLGTAYQNAGKTLCTTDDPVDTLEHHQRIAKAIALLWWNRHFRPDKAMNVDDAAVFNAYVNKVEAAANVSVSSYGDYLKALKAGMIILRPMAPLYQIMASTRFLQQIIPMQRSVTSFKDPRRKITGAWRDTQIQICHAGGVCKMGSWKRLGTAVSPRCFA